MENRNYFVSAWVSDLYLNQNGVEALIYPSVRTKLMDVNVALRVDVFDKMFRLVETTEEIVRTDVDTDSTSVYCSKTARSSRIDAATDTIVWDPARSVPEEEVPRLHEQ